MLVAYGIGTRTICLTLGSEVACDLCHLYAAIKVNVPTVEAGTFINLHSTFQ